MIARKFRKFLRRKKFSQRFQRSDSKKENVTCYECKKPGHYKSDCPDLKKGKEPSRFERKKALKASTWDDSSDSEDESKEEEIANLCLMANDDKVCSSSTNEVNNELEENFELLLEAFKNQGRKIKDLKKANKTLEEENHFLKNKMSTLQEQVTSSITS